MGRGCKIPLRNPLDDFTMWPTCGDCPPWTLFSIYDRVFWDHTAVFCEVFVAICRWNHPVLYLDVFACIQSQWWTMRPSSVRFPLAMITTQSPTKYPISLMSRAVVDTMTRSASKEMQFPYPHGCNMKAYLRLGCGDSPLLPSHPHYAPPSMFSSPSSRPIPLRCYALSQKPAHSASSCLACTRVGNQSPRTRSSFRGQ